MWHPGELAVQERAGVAPGGEIGAEMPPVAQEFLRERPWLVVGAADEAGRMWATALYGPPGFLEPLTERTLAIHALPAPGDPLRRVLAEPAQVGAIAIEPETRRRMRLNGHSEPIDGGVLLWTEQVYSNCPKYISVRHAAAARRPVAKAMRSEALSDAQAAWIERADTFFVATRSPEHGADASHRGGNPGFVRVDGPRRLSWPDYRGNAMFNTLGNLQLDPAAGLLFVDFERGDGLQLSGRARVAWDPARAAEFPGAQRVVDFEVDAVVQLDAVAPLRWRFERHSRVSPPAPRPTPRRSAVGSR